MTMNTTPIVCNIYAGTCSIVSESSYIIIFKLLFSLLWSKCLFSICAADQEQLTPC